jgi:hypothetical protein
MLLVTVVVLSFFGFKLAVLLVGPYLMYWEGTFPLLIIGEMVAVWVKVFVFLGKNPAPDLL